MPTASYCKKTSVGNVAALHTETVNIHTSKHTHTHLLQHTSAGWKQHMINSVHNTFCRKDLTSNSALTASSISTRCIYPQATQRWPWASQTVKTHTQRRQGYTNTDVKDSEESMKKHFQRKTIENKLGPWQKLGTFAMGLRFLHFTVFCLTTLNLCFVPSWVLTPLLVKRILQIIGLI